MTRQALPPDRAAQSSANPLPESPGEQEFPSAQLLADTAESTLVTFESGTQTEQNGLYVLDRAVRITYKDRQIEADHVEYDSKSNEMTATGHLLVTGGANQERISASHGTMNLKTQTGRFYDVSGSVGMKSTSKGLVYSNGNPFLFTGRMVVKTGPQNYDVFDGTVTSCQMPHPDWLLSATHFSVDGDKARARNSIFHLLNLPLLYLPYVTHPLDAEARQSGLLIPVFGQSSSKGFIVGEQIYFVINRSMDLTVGAEYYSSVGYAQSATFHYKGRDNDFITARYGGLLDRQPPGPTNQGGEDILFSGRRDFTDRTRVAATVEYLSSYVYREAFTDNFNQAVTSDVVSTIYGVHHADGIETSLEGDRYQGIKVVQSLTAAGQQVHIFHAPAFSANATEHMFAHTGLEWSFESSLAGLKRTQPNFATGGIIQRFDLHPELAYPLGLPGGWRVRPSVALRETLYSRSRVTPYPAGLGPIQSDAGLSRSDFEARVDIRPPVLERTFALSGRMAQMFGSELKHTIQPELTYRYTAGVDNFLKVLRFDQTDVVADTNQLEYGVTQRIFLHKKTGCNTAAVSQEPGLNSGETAANLDSDTAPTGDTKEKTCPNEEWISWRLAQKYFFDQTFGGAITAGRRNIFDSTLDLSGVAFLTEPRETSPIVSRLRIRTTAKTDLEWDFDLDAGARKFTSNNVFVDVHQGHAFGALSYARLDAPGRFYTDGLSSLNSDFNQMRVLLGYGQPTKAGLSIAGNAGLDLKAIQVQYAALQTAYNWNCCGVSVEYRKFELGSVRNENVYRFNFTLANVGTAGNLKRAERLF